MKDNKIIAEFMGWDIKSPTSMPRNLHLSNLELDSGGVWVYKFDTSWDWLIPVVEKIENGGLDPHEMIDKSLRKNKQKRWRSIEDLYNVAVYLIKIHNESNKMDTLPPSVQQE